jgi:hypothetical protein
MAGVSKDGAAPHQLKGHMDVTTEAATGGSEQQPVVEIIAEGECKISLSDAARTLAQRQLSELVHKPQ